MYTAYFGLSEVPFSITPDPRYLYMSERHQEAMAHLFYGLNEGGGFVQLTGEVGTGKTTLCRCMMLGRGDNIDLALILNPRVSELELLAAICDELKIKYPKSFTAKDLLDRLNTYLLKSHADGRQAVVVIDEAQNLPREVLEQVRLLTNLETAKQKLLQIILIGQPELITLLSREDLRQLAQRITARYHLLPLSINDASEYVKHRLKVAGCDRPIFTRFALRKIYRMSGGIPRLINIICDRALLGAYAKERSIVNSKIVTAAGKEVFGAKPHRRKFAAAVLVGLALVGVLLGLFYSTAVDYLNGSVKPLVSGVDTKPASSIFPLENLLNTSLHINSRRQGVVELAAMWGKTVSVAEGSDPCVSVESMGLSCFEGMGTWRQIQSLNQPVLLMMQKVENGPHFILLQALNENGATIYFAGGRHQYQISEIRKLWAGQYLTLWQPPPLKSRIISSASDTKDILWLRRALHTVTDGDKIELVQNIDHPVFDSSLTDQVQDFQKRYALEANGIVGADTLLRISSALSVNDSPSLAKQM